MKRADNMVDHFYCLFYVPSNPANETNAKCQIVEIKIWNNGSQSLLMPMFIVIPNHFHANHHQKVIHMVSTWTLQIRGSVFHKLDYQLLNNFYTYAKSVNLKVLTFTFWILQLIQI